VYLLLFSWRCALSSETNLLFSVLSGKPALSFQSYSCSCIKHSLTGIDQLMQYLLFHTSPCAIQHDYWWPQVTWKFEPIACSSIVISLSVDRMCFWSSLEYANLPMSFLVTSIYMSRCIEFCPEPNIIASGGWDETVKLWDPRSRSSIGSYSQPGKVTILLCLYIIFNGWCAKYIMACFSTKFSLYFLVFKSTMHVDMPLAPYIFVRDRQ